MKKLISFPENNVIKRFELLKILNIPLKPEDKYEELKTKNEKAQKEIKELETISDALKVFHKEFHKAEIKKIEEKINKLNNGTIKEFDNLSKLILELGEEIEKKVEKINKLKECSIFIKLFEKTQGINQDVRYELALKNLYNEFMALKKKLKLDEKTKKEFKIIIDVLELKEDEKTQKELKYMEDSSGSEEDIKSIIYFCQNFKLNYNNSIIENKEEAQLEDFLRTINENIQINIEKEENLNKLKELGIYDCEKKGLDIVFFNLFNGQKEAIDFLLTKTHENLEFIKDKLISIDNTVKPNDIEEVDNFLDFFNNVIRNCKTKIDMFEKIKKIDENLLNNFRKFIKICPYLIDIDNNSDNTYNLYIEANKYFNNAKYNISLNGEVYNYIYKDQNDKICEDKILDLNKIKSIKHKINIPNEVEIKLKENQELPEGQEKNSLMKTLLLLKYKEVVSNIELIEKFFYVFQTKGCSLPIEIEIVIKYPEVTYLLKKKPITFGDLSKYLLNVKNYYEKTLDSNYKKEQNLRFLYGKQFDTLNNHILKNQEISSFIRYILNNLKDDEKPNEGNKSFPRSTYNYVDDYKYYSDDSFKIYNNYLSTVMKENGMSIEDLYEKMKIKVDENDGLIYKGIYLYKSESNSMEEDILKIFIKRTRNIPIA